MTIVPAVGYALIEPIEKPTTVAGGLQLPESSKDEKSINQVALRGKILKTKTIEGREVLTDIQKLFTESYLRDFGMSNYNTGESVFYKKYTHHEVDCDGKTYHLVSFKDIIGTIKED